MPTSMKPGSQGRFEELARTDCLELVSTKQVGRVALCTPHGPQVFPVNYTLHDGGILFRTAPQTEMARHLNDARVAFQVDDIDDFLQCGWSVLLVGHASHIADPDDLPEARGVRPEPWASGDRTLFIRLDPDEITGRRVHPG